MFADIILPLPIYAAFTYEVPQQMQSALKIGSRVLVQFGRSKYYTGIVENIHSRRPSDFEPKPIEALLDASPVLRHPQLKFWHWIAEYYLCSPGEVMKAALPAALKVESEAWIEIAPEADEELLSLLNERQAEVYALIAHNKKIRVSEVERKLPFPVPRTIINSLIQRGLIRMAEHITDKYVSKHVAMVKLSCERDDEETLHQFFNLTSRSAKQEKLLVAYLELSGWISKQSALLPVSREALLKKSGASPAILKALVNKGVMEVFKQSINRFLPPATDSAISFPSLSEAQSEALRNIHRNMSEHQVTLLRGVTGSGKTEIYSHLIKQALDHGDQVLFLVPEISLTTQLTTRLQRIFGKQLLVYHSKFSDNERVDIWRRLLTDNHPTVVLGVRSSIFLPFARLGLVVIDEEHEASYKQYDPAPRYNGRDAAIMLAHMHGAKVLLGSATPSIETYYKAQSGKYGLVELLTRYGNVTLPEVEIVNMPEQRKRKQVRSTFSAKLLTGIENTVQQGNQSILFQNRRGFAPVVVCAQCGWTPKCVNCDVSLVYHKHIGELRCHYCGYSMTLPKVCPACGENALATYGYGTERVADALHELYPTLRIARMDLDTTRNKDSYEQIINSFSHHDTDVLVGTQMVSKGLDFQKVKLVGILNADTLLNFPDFRSNERAFNMMEQVAGRAGRHGGSGKVIIQSSDPDNEVLKRVVAHDYIGFYQAELAERRNYTYPPFARIINIYLRHRDQSTLINLTVKITQELQRVFGKRVLGPETPFVSRVSNLHIRTLMLKVENTASMPKVKDLLRQIFVSLAPLPGMKQLLVHYDVDPV